MNKVKDIFYDKNDILIALVILCVAALIIFFRVDAIMDYPKTLAASVSGNTAQQPIGPVTTTPAVTTEPEICAIYINPGDTMQAIGTNLSAAGFFATADEFVQLVTEMGVTTQVKTGNHHIPSDATQEEVVAYILQPGL